MNDFTVIANQAIEIAGQSYQAGDPITANCHDLAQHLVFGRVRMSNTPAPPVQPVKRPRGRPRKTATTTAPTYKRRDLQAEE